MHRFRLLSALVAGFLVFALLLCGLVVWKAQMALLEKKAEVATLERKAHVPALANQAPAAVPQKPLTDVVVAEHLPPIPAGPALGVCDPIAPGDSSDTAAFGAGCTRWLQFALGNFPQLGQMPTWSYQERARQELGTPDLRLSAPQAARFARMMGYTHVAVSTITGTPVHCTLALQVYAMPDKVAVGPSASVSGSEAQVIAALPDLAQQLLTRLHVPASALPAPTLAAADLRTIGGYDWWPEGKVSAAHQQQMQTLSEREPLAGILYLLHTQMANVRAGEIAYHRLFAQAPTNLEPRAECLTLWRYFSPGFKEEIARSLPAAPNNYIVATWHWVNSRVPQEAVKNAEHLAQCAPRNPAVWTALAQQYEDVASHLRNGRNADAITAVEWTALNRLYAHQLMAAQQAASLDPDLGPAWHAVAVAATFAGHPSVADAALWKAIRLSHGSARSYLWGLEMYQPKWMGDAAKLEKVVKLAVADHALNAQGQYALAAALQKLGRVTEAQAIEAQAKAGSQAGR